jgi:TolB-like protein
MEDVRLAILIFSFTAFMSGCSTASQVGHQRGNNAPITTNAATVIENEQSQYQENQLANIDMAILEGSKYIAGRVSAGSKVAIVTIQSPTINLSNYIIDNISMYLVNENNCIVIERVDLDIIQTEQAYQASGEVSDETAVSIGKQIGAKFIIAGSVLPLGSKYSFKIKIIDTETAQIFGTKIYQFDQDRTIVALLESSVLPDPARQEPIRQENNQTPTVKGDVNITNNNTTTINGDVYINMPNGLGW